MKKKLAKRKRKKLKLKLRTKRKTEGLRRKWQLSKHRLQLNKREILEALVISQLKKE